MAEARDPNIYDIGTEARSAVSSVPGFDSFRSRVGDAAGSKRLGSSVWDLLPGQIAYPYHWHYVEEEQLFILEGTPLLRQPGGWRRLQRGAVVAFLSGDSGAHQLANDTGEAVRFLTVSTSGEPDIVHYVDERKIGVFERPPAEGHLWKMWRMSDDVSYDDGLSRPQLPEGL